MEFVTTCQRRNANLHQQTSKEQKGKAIAILRVRGLKGIFRKTKGKCWQRCGERGSQGLWWEWTSSATGESSVEVPPWHTQRKRSRHVKESTECPYLWNCTHKNQIGNQAKCPASVVPTPHGTLCHPKRQDMLSFVTTSLALKDIVLRERSQAPKTNTV